MFGNSTQHLETVLKKIETNEYFGVIRPSDGEFHILSNKTLTNIDNWTFNEGDRLQSDLMNAIHCKNPKLYIGIPCGTCNMEMYNIYNNLLQLGDRKTYANLFCNANWRPFISFLKNYKKGFHVVTCGTKEDTELPILERFIIDKYLVNNWNSECNNITHKLVEWVSTKENELFCFCAGPLSKIWIPLLMDLYPKNIYLDVGSVLDLYIKGDTNRHYAFNDNNSLTSSTCDFNIV